MSFKMQKKTLTLNLSFLRSHRKKNGLLESFIHSGKILSTLPLVPVNLFDNLQILMLQEVLRQFLCAPAISWVLHVKEKQDTLHTL